jgi:hypothetical protein
MTPEDLAALGDNTTPGPWRVGSRRLCDVETSAGALVADCGVGVADARLVAAAPELLAEVERLRARIAEMEGALPPVEIPWVETAPGQWESGAGDVVLREPCGGVSHWQSRYPWPTAPIPRAVLLRALERK